MDVDPALSNGMLGAAAPEGLDERGRRAGVRRLQIYRKPDGFEKGSRMLSGAVSGA